MKTSSIHSNTQDFHKTKPFSTNNIALAILLWFCSLCAANAQLHGTYTIDPSGSASATNYLDFHSAVTDLDSGKRYDGGTANGSGVSGPVIIKVANGTYNEQVHVFTIPGTSSTNTVLFESASGDSTKVIITYPGSNVSSLNGNFNDFVLFLEDASHVTFSKMTLVRPNSQNLNDGYFDIVLIEGGGSITVRKCKLNCTPATKNNNSPASCGININGDQKEYVPDNIFILNNLILHGNASISITGNGTNGLADNIVVDGNIIDSFDRNSHGGVNATSVNKLILTSNYFGAGFAGIITQHILDLQIIGNIIYGGVMFDDDGAVSTPGLFANNVVFGGGVNSIGDTLINVYYNTFFNSSVEPPSGFSSHFSNNIVFDTTSSLGASDKMRSDYNNYIVNPKIYFCTTSSTSYTTLKAWQGGTGNDLHSKQINPDFVSNTYLAPQNPAMNFGTPISGITTDINGNPRDPNYPTVGAFNGAYIKDTTICKGYCATFTSPLSGSKYKWSTGDSSVSITYCPTTNAKLWVRVQYDTAVADTVLMPFYVYVTSTSCVWPGDANADGKVDMNDVLSVGIAYNDTGAKRPNASDGWYAQSCDNWSNSFTSGVNHKNADCNGDGKADSTDLAVISLNYSKTHSKTNAMASGNPNNPPLSIAFSNDSAMAGDTVTATISLGSKAIPASDVYGLAVSIDYGSVSPPKYNAIDLTNSWLGTYNKNMVALVVNDGPNQKMDLGITRTDHTNASGYGQIAKVSITMPDNLAGKREVKQFIHFNITGYRAISANEDTVPLYPMGDSILAYEYKSAINPMIPDASDLQVFPNPAQNILHIQSANNRINKLSISDIFGRTVYSSVLTETNEIDLPINSLSKGIYILNISTQQGIIRTRFVKN